MRNALISGFQIGVVFMILVASAVSYAFESRCEAQNNVADCKWVSVPVEPVGSD